jgi:tight adherence protein B
MEPRAILVFILVAGSVAGIAWALLPYLTGEIRAERRQEGIAAREAGIRHTGRPRDALSRRSQVAESMKELEARQKKRKNLSMSLRLAQAGLTMSKQRFFILSAIAAAALGFGVFIVSGNYLLGALALFVGGFGVPRWILSHLRKRRQEKFLEEFPNAIDVIVRGVKAGLPLGDSMRVVSTEAQEPVRSEFKEIMQEQSVGVPFGDATAKLFDRVGVPEANFFAIVIAIQQKSGGSLADTLGNLSKVVRERRKMKAKITAVSMEAKASASIIGSLPIIVMGLVWLTSPNYIELLWTHDLGRIMMAGSAFWMMCGVLVMRKMINFDF